MRSVVNDCKLAKVFVQRYENSAFVVSVLQDFLIARIFPPLSMTS